MEKAFSIPFPITFLAQTAYPLNIVKLLLLLFIFATKKKDEEKEEEEEQQ